MHRIPLRLPELSITWDRNQPEYILFPKAMNERNLRENRKYISILEEEAYQYIESIRRNADKQIIHVLSLIKSATLSNYVLAMRILNAIILRSPHDTPAYAKALMCRGSIYFEECSFEGASKDLEMFLFVQKTTTFADMCEVYGKLVVSHYLMRRYDKTKKYLRGFYKYKGKLTKDVVNQSKIETIQLHIAKFSYEMDTTEDVVPKFSQQLFTCRPYKGFNTNQDLSLTSAACYYSETGGMFAKCAIPIDSVVLVEQPLLKTANVPFVQCEFCFHKSRQIYTCFECRQKGYCSLSCMKKDKVPHEVECAGYKNLLFLMLDATSLFKLFARTSKVLHERVFNQKAFKKLPTASAVLDKIKSVILEKGLGNQQYLKLLLTKPDYMKLKSSQYATLVAIAFRLTVFMEANTFALEAYYSKLNMPNKEKMILIGSILMRLDCHILNHSFDFQFHYPIDTIPTKFKNIHEQIAELGNIIAPIREGFVEDPDAYYEIKVKERTLDNAINLLRKGPEIGEDASSVPIYEHTIPCHRINRLATTFKDKLAELFFNPDYVNVVYGGDINRLSEPIVIQNLCWRISEMDEIERELFVMRFARYFHVNYIDYFLEIHARIGYIQQVSSLLCLTLSKFRHSCVPNVEIILIRDGIVVGKTCREISKDEELVVSYKANYMRHTRPYRESFLKNYDIKCRCEYCMMSAVHEPSNARLGIFCDNCVNITVTPIEEKCPQCHTSYMELLERYRTDIKILDRELGRCIDSKVADREIYILHMVCILHVNRFFTPSNEFRISMHLRHAKFLALKNFAYQAYQVIMNIRGSILQYYHEHFIWFTFYAEILEVIKIILYYNLESKLYSVPTVYLRELCKFGMYIVEGQKKYIYIFESFDTDSAEVMYDLRLFLQWKKKILCNDVYPVAESSNRAHQKTDVDKPPLEVMPTLSKII